MSSNMICRVCTNALTTEENQFKFNVVADIYYRLTALQPLEAILPDGTCQDCYGKLLLFDSFRTMCLDAYNHLRNVTILQLETIKKEIVNYAKSVASEPTLVQRNSGDVVAGEVEDLPELKNTNSDDCVKDKVASKDTHTKKKVAPKSTAKRKPLDKIYCEFCEKFFYSEERYEAHIRVHQGLKPVTCEICNKEFAKYTYLKVHIELVHTEVRARVTCDIEGCGLTFASTTGMLAHKALKHLGKQLPKRPHVCEYCGKVFQNSSLLKTHRDKHEGIKKNTCNICGRSHDSRHKLKLHMMRHEGIKQFQCTVCGLKTVTISHLKVHMNRHTNEKQYPCELCGAVFNSSGNKSRHVKLVHFGVKNFKCTYCSMAFGKAETLKNHTMIHTGEKPHGCDICGKRFIQLVAMQTHMRTHNK